MSRATLPALACLCWLVSAAPAGADTDLLGAYRRAVENDPVYLSERANAEAEAKEVAKAAAGLVPSLGFSGQASRNHTRSTTKDSNGIETETRSYYNSQLYALTLRQPLYRKQNWAQFRESQATAARAKAAFAESGQALALRVAAAYLEAVLADAQLRVETARKEALETMLELTQRAFKAGASTLTDVYDVQARKDLASASAIEADNALHNALMTLRAVMGADPGRIALVDAARLPKTGPDGTVEEWLARAEKANHNLETLRQELEAARQERSKAMSGHFPSLDAIAVHRRATNELDVNLDRGTKTSLVGLQMSLPLFSGGYSVAAVAQASLRIERASKRLEGGRREIELDVRREHGNLRQFSAKVAALGEAVVSTEKALAGSEKGVTAGTRTTLDVLNAQDQLFRTRAELARACGQFVLSFLRLQGLAGALDARAVETVNAWLERP